MSNLQKNITNNINSILIMLLSKGVKKISLPKLILYINRVFNIQLDENSLSEILSKNKSIASSIEGNTIVLGEKPEEDELDDSIHEKAVDQAGENLMGESLRNNFKMFENIHIGDVLKSREIVLEEDAKDYFLHKGARKHNYDYIVSELCPKKNVNESYVRCKINGESIYIDIPIKSIKLNHD